MVTSPGSGIRNREKKVAITHLIDYGFRGSYLTWKSLVWQQVISKQIIILATSSLLFVRDVSISHSILIFL